MSDPEYEDVNELIQWRVLMQEQMSAAIAAEAVDRRDLEAELSKVDGTDDLDTRAFHLARARAILERIDARQRGELSDYMAGIAGREVADRMFRAPSPEEKDEDESDGSR